MYNLHLSAEQLEIRDTIRDFVAQEIKPVVLKADRLDAGDRRLPTELVTKSSQIGLRTLALSEVSGGAGADTLTCCIVTEELAAGDPDVAAALSETATLAPVLFEQLMTSAQRERLLPAFLSDDRYHLALAEHEPENDSALGGNYHRPAATAAAPTTTAARDGDAWVLNGAKSCVGNAPLADLFAVQVQTARSGVSTVLVPAASSGLTLKESDPGRRRHRGCGGELILDNVRVSAENLLGAEGQSPLSALIDARRDPQRAALNLGIGRAAYEAALDYAKLRVQGGRRIIEHQAIGTNLAWIGIRLEVAPAIIWQAAWAADHPGALADRSLSELPLATIAQVFTAEAVYAATKEAAECFGAMGVMRDMPLQKYVHDALLCLHSGTGTGDAKLRSADARG